MNAIISNVLQNLLSSLLWVVIASTATFLGTKAWGARQKKKRLETLRQIAQGTAIALCVRIGGRGNPA